MAEIHWQSKVRIGSCIDDHLHRNDPATPRRHGQHNSSNCSSSTKPNDSPQPHSNSSATSTTAPTSPIILIGMPGIDQRFRHYPQLYSRLGFSHRYRALGRDELLFVLDRHWKRLGRSLDPDDFTDAQAIAAIERITRGNFRLLERLFPQIARVLKINQLETITDDVIEAAASILVIGN